MSICIFRFILQSAVSVAQPWRWVIAAGSLFLFVTPNAVSVTFSSDEVTVTNLASTESLGPVPTGQMLKNFETELPGNSPKALSVAPTRAQVVAIYNTEYLPGNTMPPMNWTGSLAGCNPGAIDVAYQQSMIDRVNVFRKLARLSPVVRNTTAASVNGVQAAALLMSANNSLNHMPPSNWVCYNTAYAGGTVGSLGGTAAGKSNLGMASGNLYTTNAIIDAYMVDSGAGNAQTGHRTNMLDSQQGKMASGVVPGGSGANALWVLDFGTRSNPASTPDGVAWPPKNAFVPYQLLPAGSNRWSFQYPGANFSAATVSMTSGGSAYAPVAYEFKSTGCPSGSTCLPDDAIVWRPPLDSAGINGVFYTSPGATDKAYTVTINGVSGSGVPPSFSYVVTVIDPSISPAQTISGTITNGSGIAGVSFCARPAVGVSCNTSVASGAYSCTVPNGWAGTLHSPSVANNRIPPQTFTAVTASVTRNITALSGVPGCNLDVDNNGLIEPTTDGAAILRRMLGFKDAAFAGLAGTCAANTTGTAIFNATTSNYNVTGGVATRASTDGMVILRAMNGKTGTDVTNGLGLSNESGASNTGWSAIQSWLNTTCGSNF